MKPMTKTFLTLYASLLTLLVIVYFIQLAVIYTPDHTIRIEEYWYEYHVNLEPYGYEVYDKNGNHIGTAYVGDCDLDNLFINDNQ